MSDVGLPERLTRSSRTDQRSCPGHRAWVRRHHCSITGCKRLPIECAHVRGGTDGGIGLKPSDRWCISLCSYHHGEQHRIGEGRFESKYELDLLRLSTEFARRSPHWPKLQSQTKAMPDNDVTPGRDPVRKGGKTDALPPIAA